MTRLKLLLLGALAVLAPVSRSQPQQPISGSSTPPPSPAYAVVSSTRNIELAGTVTREQQVVTLRSNGGSGEGEWWMPLDQKRWESMSWLEVVEGKRKMGETTASKLPVHNAGFDPSTRLHWIRVSLPSSKPDISLTLNSHFVHLTTPLPERLAQSEGAQQGMLWEGDLLGGFGQLDGAVASDAEVRVRFKTPTPLVYGKSTSSGFTVSQNAGSSTTMFQSKGTSLAGTHVGSLHYNQPEPVVAVGNWSRLVEVSHWGNNIAVEDQIKLENRGPALKGFFSRIDHQTMTYTRKPGAVSHILTSLSFRLPPHVSSPYYTDTIGNVSTSRFRPSSPSSGSSTTPAKLKKNRREATDFSTVELVPRYPIVGGWNYSFTLGWNVPGGDFLRLDAQTGKYVVKVPMFQPIREAAVDIATLRVRLPEGSRDVEVWTPFPVDSTRTDIVDKTFLDTTGRPVVLITKSRCTEKHVSDVYISYRRSPLASLQKPAAVAACLMAIFLLGGLLQRLEWTIGR